MKVVLISDTHNQHNKLTLPEGDMLIHCGDATSIGGQKECEKFLDWYGKQSFKYKILIAGNHDWGFDHEYLKYNEFAAARGFGPMVNERSPNHVPVEELAHHLQKYARKLGIIYLNDSGIEIRGTKFFGSPRSKYYNGWAFNGQPDINHDWSNIPDDTNFLITHGPPWGILDYSNRTNGSVGDTALLERVYELKNLKVHAFGHLHECPGQRVYDGVTFINAATCNLRYEPVNEIQIYDL